MANNKKWLPIADKKLVEACKSSKAKVDILIPEYVALSSLSPYQALQNYLYLVKQYADDDNKRSILINYFKNGEPNPLFNLYAQSLETNSNDIAEAVIFIFKHKDFRKDDAVKNLLIDVIAKLALDQEKYSETLNKLAETSVAVFKNAPLLIPIIINSIFSFLNNPKTTLYFLKTNLFQFSYREQLTQAMTRERVVELAIKYASNQEIIERLLKKPKFYQVTRIYYAEHLNEDDWAKILFACKSELNSPARKIYQDSSESEFKNNIQKNYKLMDTSYQFAPDVTINSSFPHITTNLGTSFDEDKPADLSKILACPASPISKPSAPGAVPPSAPPKNTSYLYAPDTTADSTNTSLIGGKAPG